MLKLRQKFVCLWMILGLFFASSVDSRGESLPSLPSSPFSIAALTWNVGNQTAKDNIVKGFVNEIKTLQFPDVIVVGT